MVFRTMASSDFSPDVPRDFAFRLIPAVTADVGRRSDETSPVPSLTLTASRSPYAGGFFGTVLQDLGAFRGLRLCMRGSAPSGSLRANMSTLQDSRDATGCCVAPLPQGDTPLQHLRSPRSTGRLLRGLLAVTTITGRAAAARAATTARWHPPGASSPIRWGPLPCHRLPSSAIPASSFVTVQRVPVGRSAMSSGALATSLPTNPWGDHSSPRLTGPTLYEAGALAPGTCTGVGRRGRAGPRAAPVSVDLRLDGRSRPHHGLRGFSHVTQ